ncbi:MAG TPA: type II secretion system protein [Saccharofermentans sp.]|nr:type II secretion system protein [Saccharofermentans sp.]HPQ32563.1 type II secretion system protein [Saccharofermentans sp.]
MKKISKSKKGFTLVEMVLVIAIICILAAVLVLSVTEYIDRANKATSVINDNRQQVAAAVSEIDDAVGSISN